MDNIKAKTIYNFLKDKNTMILVNNEIIDEKEIGKWGAHQGLGYLVFIPIKIIKEIKAKSKD